MAKHVYDVRGSQSRIFRLYCYDREALVHMVFYRVAVIFAILAAITMVASFLSYGNPLDQLSERFVFILGILLIPQLFGSMKAFSIIASHGVVFGRLNPSFMKYGIKERRIYSLYKLIPYIVTVVWVIALVWLGVLWSI